MVIECGDFNVHLGKESVQHTYHESINNNGKLLLEHATSSNLIITNTMFTKRKGKLWTYISDMNNTKSQIDYILISRKWKNSLYNCEAYNSFSSIGSDHRLLTAKIKLSLRKAKIPARKNKYDWPSLRNLELRKLYTITVHNSYAELCTDNDNFTEKYAHFVNANSETAVKLIPIKKKNKDNKIASDRRIEEMRQNVNKAFAAFNFESNDRLQQELKGEK